MKLLVFHRHRWRCNSLNLISVEYRSGYSTFTIVIFLPLQTRFFCGVGIAKNTTRSCMTWTWNLIWCHFQTVGKWGIVTAWAEGPFLWEWIDIHLFFIFCFVILVITQITVVNEVKVEFLSQKTWNQLENEISVISETIQVVKFQSSQLTRNRHLTEVEHVR